jgi:hypothetical protein
MGCGQGCGWEIHRIANATRLEVITDSFGSHGGGGIFGLFGRGTEMRKDDGVGMIPEEVIGEVGDISAFERKVNRLNEWMEQNLLHE